MKVFWIDALYREAIKTMFSASAMKLRENQSYHALKQYVDGSYANYFSTAWCRALRGLGYEAENVVWNVPFLQKAWQRAYEQTMTGPFLEEILFRQIKTYQPDILFAGDCCSAAFLRRVREKVASLRLLIGWAGSAVAMDPTMRGIWKEVDLIFCCAPESVSYLHREGAPAVHMNHAFPADILSALHNHVDKQDDISFIGSIVRGKAYHLFRERLLLGLLGSLPLTIYSPSTAITRRERIKTTVVMRLYDLAHLLPDKLRTGILSKIPLIGRVCAREEQPMMPVNDRLRRRMKPPIFGIEMFQALRHSNIVLNIHADSSPRFASNMRMFEATGVGTCLLTDRKEKMDELFVPGQEIVTYDSVEDCIEKAKWLQAHPRERQEIAEAGQRRCLKEHTYEKRAVMFDHIVKKALHDHKRNK